MDHTPQAAGEAEAETAGLGRRSLLKKAAVGGVVAWAAPTVLTSAAHAQGSGPAMIDGAVDSFSQVTISSYDGGGPFGGGAPVPGGRDLGWSDHVTADSNGYYVYLAEPGYNYQVKLVCGGLDAGPYPVNASTPGTYDVSCPVA